RLVERPVDLQHRHLVLGHRSCSHAVWAVQPRMSLKAHSEPSDTPKVRAGQSIPPTMDGVLDALPPELVVARDGEARFVAGPAGAFVLAPAPAPGSDVDAAERLLGLAQRTRAELCRHVAWVPFVDALLVSGSRRVRRSVVTVAPLDLLAVVLTEG